MRRRLIFDGGPETLSALRKFVAETLMFMFERRDAPHSPAAAPRRSLIHRFEHDQKSPLSGCSSQERRHFRVDPAPGIPHHSQALPAHGAILFARLDNGALHFGAKALLQHLAQIEPRSPRCSRQKHASRAAQVQHIHAFVNHRARQTAAVPGGSAECPSLAQAIPAPVPALVAATKVLGRH
jgi:hypothetical protein